MNAVVAYFMTMFSRFEDKAKGATAVEYGIMVALIAVAIIVTVTAIGKRLKRCLRDRPGPGLLTWGGNSCGVSGA